jgi:hypothetical protein
MHVPPRERAGHGGQGAEPAPDGATLKIRARSVNQTPRNKNIFFALQRQKSAANKAILPRDLLVSL